MSLPGGRSDQEREQARLERERRRAERAGRQTEAPAEPPSAPPSDDGMPPSFEWSAPPPVESAPPPPPAPPKRSRAPRLHRPHLRERVDSVLARSAGGRRAAAPAMPGSLDPEALGEPHRPGGNGADGPPRRGRRRRLLGPFALVLLIVVVAVLWFLFSMYQPGKSADGPRVSVTVPHGGTLGVIADRLNTAGVISSPFFFKLRARIAGHTSDLKPGVYELRKDMPYSDVLTKLTQGPPKRVLNITVPEGRARSEIAPLVKAAGISGDYLKASVRAPALNLRRYRAPRRATLEGFLFPATYELKLNADATALVTRQVEAFKQSFAKVDMSYARKKNLTPYDIVTIASMVEREAQVARERPLIASVMYNRLKRGMPLGIDATIRYATGNWTRPLRMSELRTASPYNTRTRRGLPPGPIGNPGLSSLQAAARPARTNYLFYVVKPDRCGEHAFSSTDAQFQRDVAKYNAARAKKGGKSPTSC
jgi:uncharacterized YceG family protein